MKLIYLGLASISSVTLYKEIELEEKMTESKVESPGLLRVFVYGTLKPGEENYQIYCAGKIFNATEAVALGKLFALPMGYPAMTPGDSHVYGYLLSFTDINLLTALDELEDYHPSRTASENLYNRKQIETYDLQGNSLGWAWVYLMAENLAFHLKGIHLPDGRWSSFKD